MNLLLENGLPEEIDGRPIFPDFRNMIRLEQLLKDEAIPEPMKLLCGLRQLFADVPDDTEYAVRKLLWFYGRGRDANAGQTRKNARSAQRAYDFDEDDALIYASFRMAYNIRLTEVSFLHWWEFSALLQSLPDTTPMGRVMYLRTVELDTIRDKEQRKRIAEQKEYWRLKPLNAGRTGLSLAELEQTAKEQARRRMEQARREQERLTQARGKDGSDNV